MIRNLDEGSFSVNEYAMHLSKGQVSPSSKRKQPDSLPVAGAKYAGRAGSAVKKVKLSNVSMKLPAITSFFSAVHKSA
jgi:hypothetical protein